MPTIQPFRGLRYDLGHVGELSQVVAPPYDVIDSSQQDELYRRHPANVVRLILNRSEPGDEGDEDRYLRAARFLRTWRQEGILREDPQPAVYFYQQDFHHEGQTLTRSGLLCRVRLEPFGHGTIYPHEETHAAAKSDRLKLTRACKANLSPVFGLCPDPENFLTSSLSAASQGMPPVQAVEPSGVVHRLWPLTDGQVIGRIAQWLAPQPTFIADGHHRYETALNYRAQLAQQGDLPPDHPSNFVLMMLVGMNDPGMVVLPTHRLFRGVPARTSESLKEVLGDSFETRVAGEGAALAPSLWQQIEAEGQQHTLGLFTDADSRWTVARISATGRQRMDQLAADHSPVWRGLGVSILQRLVLQELLGATGLPKPMYVHSVEEVVHYIDQGDIVGRDATGQSGTGGRFPLVALVMPATLDHVRRISERGERMPAKSTYFYPKLLSGLVIHPLGD